MFLFNLFHCHIEFYAIIRMIIALDDVTIIGM